MVVDGVVDLWLVLLSVDDGFMLSLLLLLLRKMWW